MKRVNVLVEKRNGTWFAVAARGGCVEAVSIGLTKEGCLKALRADNWIEPMGEEREFASSVIDALCSIYRGERAPHEVALKLNLERLSSTARCVLQLVAQIPLGCVSTYASIAKAVGTSPRAVGRILATNPFPLLIPCHRVICSDGRLGGYVAGQEVKRRLLENEWRGKSCASLILRISSELPTQFNACEELRAA